MKQTLLIIIWVIAGIPALCQSITLDPYQSNEISIIKKEGIGFSHQSVDGSVKVGTKLNGTEAIIQTHTNHNLGFSTNNVAPQMTLSTSGLLGIGTQEPLDILDIRSPFSLRASVIALNDGYAGIRFKNDLGHYFMGINTFTDRWVIFDNISFEERLSLNSQGFFGINQSVPNAHLQVNGNSILSETPDFTEQVLIGTDIINSESKLYVRNSIYPYAVYIDGAASGSGKALKVDGGMEVTGPAVMEQQLVVNDQVAILGNLSVAGTLSKAAGTFKIDHPADPENKILYHSFVESPDMMNIYNGNVVTDENGNARVELPGYFEALNMDFRYQLTSIGQFSQAIVSEEISGNTFRIQTDKPRVKVSWQVTGIRNDAYAQKFRTPVEVEKTGSEKGKYLNPEAFDKTNINQ